MLVTFGPADALEEAPAAVLVAVLLELDLLLLPHPTSDRAAAVNAATATMDLLIFITSPVSYVGYRPDVRSENVLLTLSAIFLGGTRSHRIAVCAKRKRGQPRMSITCIQVIGSIHVKQVRAFFWRACADSGESRHPGDIPSSLWRYRRLEPRVQAHRGMLFDPVTSTVLLAQRWVDLNL